MLKIIMIICVIVVVLLFLLALSIVNYSTDEMLDKYKKISTIPAPLTPLQFTQIINQKYFNNSIKIKFTKQMFGDSFRSNGELCLCSAYSNQKQLGGLTICAHELGHAFQYAFEQNKMKEYSKKIKTSSILSKLITPLILASIVLIFFDKLYISLGVFALAILFFIFALSVKLSTIKIEKEASEKAMELLCNIANINEFDLEQCKNLLNSAKMTYVADFLRSMIKWTGLVK